MNLSNIFGNKPKTFDVSQVKYKKPVDEQLVHKLSDYIQLTAKHLSKMGLHKIMVGIFETNSLVAATLLKQILKDQVIAMILDFGTEYTNKLAGICNNLNLDAYILKRGKAYQEEMAVYGKNPQHYKRFTAYHLLIQADQMKAALIDTIDKSDRLLGTRPLGFYGHFMPFYSLYKSEIFELAKYLNIPVESGQTYQNFTYDKIDPVLYLLSEKQLNPEEISQEYNIDVDYNSNRIIDLNFLKRLKSHVDKQLFQTPVSQFII